MLVVKDRASIVGAAKRVWMPPGRCGARQMVAWLLIGWGLIRLLGVQTAGDMTLIWLPWLPGFVLPGLKIAIGIALWASMGRWRLAWYGRLIAVFGAAYCALLAVVAWPYWNGIWPYALSMLVLLREAGSNHECR